ncbi:MAG: PLP-dependent aspartate aminotransferase family protein [Ignavibacteriae bacterium]|nr:PLP-dependent aspartate aminotransferase family protein [Ignavibacteriota bacterium]
MRLQTLSIHTGVDKDSSFNSVITPIYASSTFEFEDIGKTKGYDYSRTANPTRTALQENLAALEGGAGAIAIATGMAAIATVLHLLKTGDHIICTNDCYGGTERLLRTYRELHGIQVTYVNMGKLDNVRKAIQPNTKALWIETPSNPLLNIIDIRALADIAHEIGALAIVDNTFLSPYNQRPFELGADIIVHSTTKYLNGHSDVVGGAAIAVKPEHAERLQWLCNALGQGASPFDCWLVLRGIKTLVPRMRLHEENANTVAKFLSQHPNVARVYYPGLPTHPNHDLARRQQYGFGGMVSFEVNGGVDEANHVLRSVKVFAVAESLGGIESLISHTVSMTHASMDPKLRAEAGINERILRLSVGLEDINDLLEDLDRALSFKTVVPTATVRSEA